jgi:hypothetical protein
MLKMVTLKSKGKKKMVSFLKNLGNILSTGLNVANVLTQNLGPVIATAAPATAPAIQNISDELPKIAEAIVQAEAIGQLMQLSGPDKLKIAVPWVTQVVLKSPLMAGKAIAQPEVFKQAIVDLTNGVVGILNSVAAPGQVAAAPAALGADKIG